MKEVFDVIIVGGGPAGLFAAKRLLDSNQELEVALFEEGDLIENRSPNELMKGIGGVGTFSDGKLHFSPILSHEKALHLIPLPVYQEYLDKVDQIFTQMGVDAPLYPKDTALARKLVAEAEQHGIKLHVRKIKHVGSDKLVGVIATFQRYLLDKGLIIFPQHRIDTIVLRDGKCVGVKNGTQEFFGKQVILAPGRTGTKWLQSLAEEHQLGYINDKVEIGVRVEFPASLMKTYSDALYEAIFAVRTPTFDDIIRTFCPCPNGMVAQEDYQGFVCVNGHSCSDHSSPNSNFAFVSEVVLTEPIENTTIYAELIAKIATTLGGGRAIVQRLGDLRVGRRSTPERIRKSFTRPTLTTAVPGDIAMCLPHRIVTNIVEGLDILNNMMPGIAESSTLLYAPEVKFRSSRIKTDKTLQTKIKNLYVAGDGAGVSGNIVGAAATGMIVADSISQQLTNVVT